MVESDGWDCPTQIGNILTDGYAMKADVGDLRRAGTMLGLVSVLLYSSVAKAEDLSKVTAPQDEPAHAARYRLAEREQQPKKTELQLELEAMPTEEDFTWEALTKKGPATGADPLLGAHGSRSYHDFKDGLKEPRFIAAKVRSKA